MGPPQDFKSGHFLEKVEFVVQMKITCLASLFWPYRGFVNFYKIGLWRFHASFGHNLTKTTSIRWKLNLFVLWSLKNSISLILSLLKSRKSSSTTLYVVLVFSLDDGSVKVGGPDEMRADQWWVGAQFRYCWESRDVTTSLPAPPRSPSQLLLALQMMPPLSSVRSTNLWLSLGGNIWCGS